MRRNLGWGKWTYFPLSSCHGCMPVSAYHLFLEFYDCFVYHKDCILQQIFQSDNWKPFSLSTIHFNISKFRYGRMWKDHDMRIEEGLAWWFPRPVYCFSVSCCQCKTGEHFFRNCWVAFIFSSIILMTATVGFLHEYCQKKMYKI
jgi:hypothetical protein